MAQSDPHQPMSVPPGYMQPACTCKPGCGAGLSSGGSLGSRAGQQRLGAQRGLGHRLCQAVAALHQLAALLPQLGGHACRQGGHGGTGPWWCAGSSLHRKAPQPGRASAGSSRHQDSRPVPPAWRPGWAGAEAPRCTHSPRSSICEPSSDDSAVSSDSSGVPGAAAPATAANGEPCAPRAACGTCCCCTTASAAEAGGDAGAALASVDGAAAVGGSAVGAAAAAAVLRRNRLVAAERTELRVMGTSAS